MAVCDDRQLSQAQREAGFLQQQRSGVMQAIRPFTGAATLPNLIDYLNREVYPVLRQARAKINDVYRQVTDNAPSANPLAYYFSEETTNADPTAGRLRLDSATQNTATTIRISQTNGRLSDVAPWLDVMAGSATTPLGSVTIFDATDPSRFLRFDLNTMTDQGAYWDLGVSITESSDDTPFVDDEPVVIAFVPGVASTGTTVPVSSVSPMAAHTVLGNPTNATAAPTAISMPSGLSFLGRKNATGDIVEIHANEFVPSFFSTAANLVPHVSSGGTQVFWGKLSTPSLIDFPEAHMLIRSDPTTGPLLSRTLTTFAGLGLRAILNPNYNLNVNASTSIVIDFPGTNEVQRAALTGDVTASQNSNTTAFRTFSPLSVLGRSAGTSGIPTEIAATASSEAVLHEALGSIAWGQVTTGGYADGSITDAKITNRQALSLWGRAANSVGAPADISTTSGSATVMRESGGTIGWGTVATAGLADDSVTNAKLRNSGPLSVIGRSANSTGDPADISATAASDGVLRESGSVLGFGQVATAGIADDAVTAAKMANMAARTIRGRADSAGTGDPQDLSGLQTGAILRMDNGVADTTSSGSLTAYVVAAGTNSITFNGVTVTLHGIVAPTERGQILWIRHIGAGSCSIVQESSSATAVDRLALGDNITANTTGLILGSAGGTFNRSALFMYTGSRWQRMDESIGEAVIVTQQMANNAITDAKLRDSGALSVIGRSANSSGDPADISATAASGAVLRESGSTIGFGTVANAGLATMSERRIKGRADSAGTGSPQDLTGIQTGAIIRFGNQVSDAATTGSTATYTVAASTNQVTFNSVSPVIHGISVPTEIGQLLIIQHIGSGSTSFVHESGTAGAAGQRLRLGPYASNTTALTISQNQTAVFTYDNRWVWLGSASAAYDGDHGDITVSGGGVTWTIDNNTVSDAKLRDSGALSVIGRSANSSGDPADISATASSDQVLRVSGTTLGFGTVATAGHADDSITDAKLRNSGACSVIGRSANSSGDPADISATTNDRVFVRRSNALVFDQIVTADIADGVVTVAKLAGIGANTILGNDTAGTLTPNAISVGTNTVLGRVAGNIVAAQLATGQVANNAITDGKLRQSAALSVIGRSANSTGDVADISGTASSDAVLRVSGTSLGFGTVATAGLANNAVTNAKLATMAQSRIKGRAEGAGTGDPTDLTPTEVVSIIDGETVTWTAAQNVNAVLTALDTFIASSAVFLSSIISPTVSSSQNNWNPSGLAAATVIRADTTTAASSITGITAPSGAKLLILINVGTQLLTLPNEDAGSSAANRISHGYDSPSMGTNECCILWYDTTSTRWRILASDGMTG